MVATYRLRGLGWLAVVSVAAISFYLVSSQAAAERKKLAQVDARIAAAQRDIRALETEFDVRANMTQLERWNGDTLALTIPTASQFVRGETALASLSPRALVGGAAVGAVQSAALIVPSTPVVAPPPVMPSAPVIGAVQVAATEVRAKPPAAARASIVPAAVVVRTAAAVAGSAARPKAVAMLDRSLLSDATINTLLAGARAER